MAKAPKRYVFESEELVSAKEIYHLFTTQTSRRAFKILAGLKPEGWKVRSSDLCSYPEEGLFYDIDSGIEVVRVEQNRTNLESMKVSCWGTRGKHLNQSLCSIFREVVKGAEWPSRFTPYMSHKIMRMDYGTADYKAFTVLPKSKRIVPAPPEALEKISSLLNPPPRRLPFDP